MIINGWHSYDIMIAISKYAKMLKEKIGKMKLVKDDILYQMCQFHGVSVFVGRWVSVEKMLLELFSQQPWQRPPQMRTERMKQRFGVPSAINASYDLHQKTLFFFSFCHIFLVV